MMTIAKFVSSTWSLFRSTFEEWTEDNATHHAAALAFYAIFSLAPLLIIAVGIANLFFGRARIRDQIVLLILRYVNSSEAAEFAGAILDNFGNPQVSTWATAFSLFGLFFGATAIFAELRNTLNFIWDAPPRAESGIVRAVVNRFAALLMVIGSGLALIASLLVNTLFSRAVTWMELLPFGSSQLSSITGFLIFFSVTTLVIGLIYKFVPDRSIAWSDVWIGALATALLFTIGRHLIGLFLGYRSVTSPYGAAGSLAIFLIWTYFSAQIFFLGAEFTQVYTRTYGTRWVEHDLLDDKVDEDVSFRGKHEPEQQPKRRRLPGKRVIKSSSDLAIAIGIIGAISVASFVREPFRD